MAGEGQSSDDMEGDGQQRLLPNNNGEVIVSIQDDHPVKNSKKHWSELGRKCFFPDGVRRVDYVLVYEQNDDETDTQTSKSDEEKEDEERKSSVHSRRHFFQTMLEAQDLQLETVEAKHSKTRFVLIYAPWKVLAKQAENLRLKMPIRENDIVDGDEKGCIDSMLQKIKIFQIEKEYDLEEPNYFTALFSVDRAEQFIMPPDGDRENFFSSSQRSRMVYDLLSRTVYDAFRKDHFGIGRLLANGTYSAAYPLHEGDYHIDKSLRKEIINEDGQTIRVKDNDRQLLYDTWAKPTRFFKYQPLSLVKKYFGAKIGLYFAWLGYYTTVLVPAALIGLISVIYGLITLPTDAISNDLCNATGAGGIVMCPNCDKRCTFWKLIDSCQYSKFTHVFDNILTVLFAVVMSVWGTLFLEGWKRYHAEIAWEWDLMDYEVEEEMIRPEYQLQVSGKTVVNPVTQEDEPYMPASQKIGRHLVSGVTIVFFLLLVTAFVFGAIVYRVIVIYVLYTSKDDFAKTNAPIITAITAAIINLVAILILSFLYRWFAKVLTNWECPRTQTEWDNSYTLKVFLFEFVNYYSSLFYIAFFKGKFSGVPGGVDEDREQGRYRIFGYRMEACDPAGCMVELVIELAVIMVGRQFFESFLEIIVPILLNLYRRWKQYLPGTAKQRKKWRRLCDRRSKKEADITVSRWERDYDLNVVVDYYLFNEYLEMVLQFGFVTLFVAAFPLAPIFALLNNLIEIRLDAYKFLVVNQRPMPAGAHDLGMWTPILDGVSKMAVLTNACIIAFTSDFVPKMLYFLTEGDGTFGNYVNDTLSYYNASKLDAVRHDEFMNITVCRFRDYRKPPCSLKAEVMELNSVADCDDQFGFSLQWWHIFAAKLLFVLIFEHVVFLIKAFVAYVIPDIPTHIFIKLQREQYVAGQARREYELRPKPAGPHDANANTVTEATGPDIEVQIAAVKAKEQYAAFRSREQPDSASAPPM